MKELQYWNLSFKTIHKIYHSLSRQNDPELNRKRTIPTILYFSVLCVFRKWVRKKAWVRSHLNTDALHNTYLLYLASSYLCMIKIIICSSGWGRTTACASHYKQREKPSRTMTIAFSKVISLIWVSIPIIATGPQALMCWIIKSARITPKQVS